ncbi:hypothetical protein SAMN05216203_2312 [Marinobacter daqiaonensis]|uniref:Uncharacterized protein n=1 Tax=Marinobacter daqiaonensis TaxID=650891 RepID=A0A1I6IHI0_9GAMM|nr:hypothetical protein SAMN05216203_2312 [Marinobacter daqiaonensis]
MGSSDRDIGIIRGFGKPLQTGMGAGWIMRAVTCFTLCKSAVAGVLLRDLSFIV